MNLGSKKLMVLLSLIAIALSTYVIITTLPNNAIKYVEASDPRGNEALPPPSQQPTQQPVGSSNEGNQQQPPPPKS